MSIVKDKNTMFERKINKGIIWENQIQTKALGECCLKEVDVKLNPKGLVGMGQVRSGRKILLEDTHKDPKDSGMENRQACIRTEIRPL